MKRISGFILGILFIAVVWWGIDGFSIFQITRIKAQAEDQMEQTLDIVTRAVKSHTELNGRKERPGESIAENKDRSAADEENGKSNPGHKSLEIQNAAEFESGSKREQAQVNMKKNMNREKQAVQQETSDENRPKPVLEKQYFWEPFQLESRAGGFAEHIFDISGVFCQAEKKSAGIYQVFFSYSDKADLNTKIRLIEQAGIFLNINELNQRRF